MVENMNKLEAAFVAGRMDGLAERGEALPDALEALLRMVLSDSDCTALARFSKVLFHQAADRSLRLIAAPMGVPAGARIRSGNGSKAETS